MKRTLNIGCGERVFKEYPPGYKCFNYDERALSVVDIVGDAKELSFVDEYFDYILASDIIEHFPISKTKEILFEWRRVLKNGGIIEFRLPNLKTICKAYVDGKHDAKKTSWLLYGAQSYSGNFHYVAFDPAWFKSILHENGFEVVSTKNAGNNMEIKARKK
jgi:predicted SAM-dependent methyltransferase